MKFLSKSISVYPLVQNLVILQRYLRPVNPVISHNFHSHLFSNSIKVLLKDPPPLTLRTALCSLSSSRKIDDLANLLLQNKSEDISAETRATQKAEAIKLLEFLLTKGCSADDIQESCSGQLQITHGSYLKAIMISEIDQDVLKLIPLMALSVVSLRMAVKQAREDKTEIKGFSNRIAYLSHHLETPVEDLVPALAKHSALLTMKFGRLQQKMKILKDASIDSKYIIKDLWIFNYKEQLLASRTLAAAQAGVFLKPWMLRCSEKTFASMLSKYSETQRILKGEDELNYLAHKLDCGRDYVEYMMERNKLLKAINIPKLEQVINFLFEKGYTPQEVRLFPRVFCSSVHTLSRRFEEFRAVKSTLPTISQLCTSYRKFQKTLLQKK